MKWEKVKLKEIALAIQTGPFGSQLHQSDYSKNGVPVVMPKDLLNGKISEQSIARVSKIHVNRLKRHIISNGDILYSRRGDVGRCAYATEYETGWLCGTGCLRVTINTIKANSKFIFYQLQQPSIVGWVQNHAVGSTMLNLNTAILSEIPLLLPTLCIQTKIADILSAYDELIENNQKQIKLLEEAAQRLYKEWFVDLRFPGYEKTPIIDGVPEGWEILTLDKISCRLEAGSRPKGGIDKTRKSGIVSIGAENVLGLGKYNFNDEKFIPKDYYLKMKKGKIVDKDILIYKDGAYIGKTTLFQNGYPHKEAAVNEHVFLLHMKNEYLQYFVFFTLYQHKYFLKMQQLNKNAAQPGINLKSLLSLDILVPSYKLIEQYNFIITPIMNDIFEKAKQNIKLVEIRNKLLQKLMSGEIEV